MFLFYSMYVISSKCTSVTHTLLTYNALDHRVVGSWIWPNTEGSDNLAADMSVQNFTPCGKPSSRQHYTQLGIPAPRRLLRIFGW